MDDIGAKSRSWELPRAQRSAVPDGTLLTIGQFARRSRLSTKALRLYDRLGLLTPAHVDEASGYRRYRESQLATARLVAMLRRLDMPLSLVAEIVAAPSPYGADLLARYWQAVELRVASQRELAAHLGIRLSDGEGATKVFTDIQVREIPEQLVLTEQRHVLVDELPGWLAAAMPRHDKLARELGGMTAAQFVVYHGEVTQDSDGAVEICTPIDPARDASSDTPMRREPAHREAYVRLRKAQVAYPQILSAYDAVAHWIQDEQLTIAGSPREVYFCDFAAAEPNDEVCDVAFPIE